MSSVIKTVFVLTGPLLGQSVKLGQLPYCFVDGCLEITATPEDIALHARFLERNWQAYPEGHEALEEIDYGQRDVHPNSQPDAQPPIPGALQSTGDETNAGVPASVGEGSVDTEAGTTGSVPDGDGHKAELNVKLLRAVNSLDPTNDEHWTKDGKPAITAVAAAYGATDVTRTDVETVAPGLTRETRLDALVLEEQS